MKRLKMTAAALAFCAAAAPAWAQTAGMVTGDVVSADPSNHELTIREQSSQQVRT